MYENSFRTTIFFRKVFFAMIDMTQQDDKIREKSHIAVYFFTRHILLWKVFKIH